MPRIVRQAPGKTGGQLEKKAANDPILLRTHPDRWDFHTDWGWIPRLEIWRLVPGCNGIQDSDTHADPYAQAEVIAKRDGWDVLPETVTVIQCMDEETGETGPPIEAQGYLASLPCVGGGKHHHTVWSVPEMQGGKMRIYRDELGKLLTRVKLRDDKVVIPNRASIEEKIKVAKETLERQEERINNNPKLLERCRVFSEMIGKMEESMRSLFTPKQSRVTRKRKATNE